MKYSSNPAHKKEAQQVAKAQGHSAVQPKIGGPYSDLIALQRTISNQAVEHLLQAKFKAHLLNDRQQGLGLQTKLQINEPGDSYEQEADRIAEQVMAMPARTAARSAPPRIQRLSGEAAGRSDAVPDSVHQTLASPGRPLEPAALRQGMEQRFGYDFSSVRVHLGEIAAQSARAVNANAYTVGHNVVFGAGRFAPGTHEGKRLIAHELAHVAQQSRSQLPIIAATRPHLVQRQKGDAKQGARARVEKAMKNLKTKFGLAEVTEEHGATWSESELRKVDAAFSKVSKKDLSLLKGLYLVRTDKFGPLARKGKKFRIVGETFGIGTIKLAKGAFQGDASTILHEVGHLIQNKVAEAMLKKSKANFDLEVARRTLEERMKTAPTQATQGGQALKAFTAAISQVTAAATDLLNSGEDDQAAKQAALDDAKVQAYLARQEVELLTNNDVAKAWLEVHDRQKKWVEAVERYIEEKGKNNLTGFIEVVTKNNFARKRYAPFTDYVAANWPTKPQEFFAQSFYTWRTNPKYMKKNMKALFDWFEKGGYREGKGYLESKDPIETVREVAPVVYELGREAKETFWPKALQDAFDAFLGK